jgi:asparagine synthase (glutamine-hydrolysing)
MCGLAGILNKPGKSVSPELLEEMGRVTFHRGPDNFSCIVDENVGFAHNRLSLLDLSANANQPFQNGDHILAYNGEIYNYQEIRRHLQDDFNVVFKSTSDTEVLFYSLIHDGIDVCLRNIKGMFAFSFFDKRSGELFLARDRFGIKPLYYIDDPSGFYWASEIKVLARTLGLSPEPVKTFFALDGLGEKSKRNTLFRGVYSLEPGTFLKVQNGGEICFRKYYDAVDQFDIHLYNDLNKKSPTSVVAELEGLFVRSVEKMLVSDAPLGAFVSGGVDSSLLAAVAKKKNPELKLFTANVVGSMSEYDDAKVVSRHIGAELYDYRFEPEMFLRDWAETTYYYESPIIVHTNSVPFSNVAKLARETGVKAVLTGEGADELFLGYPRLLTQRYRSIALLPERLVRSLYKLVPGLQEYLFPSPGQNVPSFLGKLAHEFEPQLDDEHCSTFLPVGVKRRVEQQMTVKMLNEKLLTLLHRNDRMGMMASIEARFPFLDEDIVKFAINLPSRFKIGVSTRFHNYKHPFLIDKWVLRKVAEKYLPERIVYKKKFGFGMIGHKFIQVEPEFFKSGWVNETLGCDTRTFEYLVQTQDRYFVAKLASLEIFGRIFSLREKIDDVTSQILKHIRLKDVPV